MLEQERSRGGCLEGADPTGATLSNARAGQPVVTAIQKSGSHWGLRGLHIEGFVVYILRDFPLGALRFIC